MRHQTTSVVAVVALLLHYYNITCRVRGHFRDNSKILNKAEIRKIDIDATLISLEMIRLTTATTNACPI